ncbi:Crp/Fnr family transcriptional regulator [Microlunatus ginsengisoli]|uniref:Crp/Fnr family transcriptional regulator n=1 Tax=Microlunatus ginsengisoli TaxID=363863 RepID=UPI0031D8106A
MHPNSIAVALGQTAIFGGLGAGELAELGAACRSRSYRRGQFLWYQGDSGDYLAVVAEGQVKVTATTVRGDEMVLATLTPYAEVGQLAVIDQGPRSASVVALAPSTAILVSRPQLLELMQHSPELLDALLVSMGRLVRQVTDRATDLVYLDLGARLAKLLLQHDRERPGGRHEVELGLTQTELAQMVGGSRAAVNRVLQDFAGRGLIQLDARAIVIRDRDGLARRASA